MDKKKKKDRPLFYDRGIRRMVTEIMLANGILPQKGLFLLGNGYVISKKVKQMIGEGVCSEVVYNQKHIYTLANFENKSEEYLNTFRKGTYGMYNKYCLPSVYAIRQVTDKAKAMRTYKGGLVYEMMYAAGIACTYEQKKELSKVDTFSDIPCYYSSIETKQSEVTDKKNMPAEVKDYDGNVIKLSSSRANGTLFSKGGMYTVYNLDNEHMRWFDHAEQQYSWYVQSIGRSRGLVENKTRAIVYYRKESLLKDILEGNTVRKYMYIGDIGYDRMYMLPYSYEGMYLTRYLTDPRWEETYTKLIAEPEWRPHPKELNITCDMIDNDHYYYFFISCDIVRLHRFIIAAKRQCDPQRFVVYCFDFQTKALEEYAGDYITIYEISMNEFRQDMPWE